MVEMVRISVNESLPEERIKVLTYGDSLQDYVIQYLIRFQDGNIWSHILVDDHNKVTHWMPLPKPPGKVITMKIEINAEEVEALLTLINNEIWDETRGEDKLFLVKELTKKLETAMGLETI